MNDVPMSQEELRWGVGIIILATVTGVGFVLTWRSPRFQRYRIQPSFVCGWVSLALWVLVVWNLVFIILRLF